MAMATPLSLGLSDLASCNCVHGFLVGLGNPQQEGQLEVQFQGHVTRAIPVSLNCSENPHAQTEVKLLDCGLHLQHVLTS